LPKFREVDWSKAECWGINTDLFYQVEEERNAKAYIFINAVRTICSRCPIFNDCLAYGFGHEQYGVWGGMTTLERRAVVEPKKYPAQLRRALFDLEAYGITYKQIREAYEYSRNDGSVENEPTDHGENGSASYRRPRE